MKIFLDYYNIQIVTHLDINPDIIIYSFKGATKYAILMEVVLPDPFQGTGARRNSVETQQSGHISTPKPDQKWKK